MLGSVEKITYDGEFVRLVELRLPQRGSAQGQLLSIRTCERIGQGSFGTVYRAVCDGYPKLALKIATGKSARLRQELEVLVKVCTKGKLLLPRFEFGAINRAADLIAVGMELCVPSTLHDLLLATRLTSEADMLFLAYQVLQAVASVHEQRCIHRDVKLQNFVFDLDGNLKLIDFGLASSVWNPPAGDVVAGTVSFMAPEMAHNALHRDQRVSVGAPADVWSAGIVLFSIFTQRNPYPPSDSLHTSPDCDDDDDDDVSCGAAASSTTLSKENIRLLCRVAAGDWQWPVGSSVSNELRQLVESILVRDPEKRPDVLTILSKPIWNARRRSPPAAVTAFLGVQDDLLLSHDETHLLRAVEQRSADVTASLMGSRTNSPDGGDIGETEQRSSLKFVAREERAVGGVLTHQIYDVRREAKQKKPVREISVVIAEETAKGLKQRRPKKSRDGALLSIRSSSCTSSRVESCAVSRATSPTTQYYSGEDKRITNVKKEAALAGGNVWPILVDLDEKKVKTVEEENKKSTGEVFLVNSSAVYVKEYKDTNHNGGSSRFGSISEQANHTEELASQTLTQCAVSTFAREISQPSRRKVGVKKPSEAENFDTINAAPSKRGKKEIIKGSFDNQEAITLIATEVVVRKFAEEIFLFEQKCFVCGLSLMIEEAQGWHDMTWLEEEQRRSAAHPHQFKETTRVTKKYQYGFVCDLCHYEFLPEGKRLYFFHCTCGRDLCPECREAYAKQCTCAVCGKVYENGVALRNHRLEGICGATKVKGKGSFSACRQQVNGRARVAPTTTTTRANGDVRSKPPATTAIMATKTTTTPRSPPKKEAEKLVKCEVTKEAVPSSLFSRTINKLPEGDWKPMERLSVSYRPIQPTMEEREMLLNGDWIRHFHLFPTEEGVESVAFTYHIQPGRTGAIFLNHSFPMHSAVISVLERQMLIVDYVDTYESRDAARLVSLGHAKCVAEGAYNLLQKVVAYDCNMIKQHRAPGTVSIYRTSQTALRCHGDPFVYVRWFRFDTEHSLSAFLLSNGSVQVLVGDQYELRWFDEDRKFLLRSNGVCEMVDDATFALAPDVSRLLYEDF